MLLDIFFLGLLVLAVFKGLRKGLIVALFSVFGLLLGIAAAIKLSAVVAESIDGAIHLPSKWLPALGFALVFIAVVLIVRWIANLIREAIDYVFLGWIDKLGGVVLYICIYVVAYSVLLFYATRLHIVSQHMISSSVTYPFIEPWGPIVVNALGKVVPIFKNMFNELEHFFADFAY